jgi:hypothetical protein
MRLDLKFVEDIRVHQGMGGALGVPWVGYGGGLAMFWTKDVKV